MNDSMDLDTTPDDMGNLEWEDEFNEDLHANKLSQQDNNSSNNISTSSSNSPNGSALESSEKQLTSLYVYYAKTFEQTGDIIENFHLYSNTSNIQDPHVIDRRINTPLHYAAERGHFDCVQLLLDHGANVNAVNENGYTPLHMGVKYLAVTKILLKNGANPNLKTYDGGESPLHIAIQQRHVTMVSRAIGLVLFVYARVLHVSRKMILFCRKYILYKI